jgi:hypothetical protein
VVYEESGGRGRILGEGEVKLFTPQQILEIKPTQLEVLA